MVFRYESPLHLVPVQQHMFKHFIYSNDILMVENLHLLKIFLEGNKKALSNCHFTYLLATQLIK